MSNSVQTTERSEKNIRIFISFHFPYYSKSGRYFFPFILQLLTHFYRRAAPSRQNVIIIITKQRWHCAERKKNSKIIFILCIISVFSYYYLLLSMLRQYGKFLGGKVKDFVSICRTFLNFGNF